MVSSYTVADSIMLVVKTYYLAPWIVQDGTHNSYNSHDSIQHQSHTVSDTLVILSQDTLFVYVDYSSTDPHCKGR